MVLLVRGLNFRYYVRNGQESSFPSNYNTSLFKRLPRTTTFLTKQGTQRVVTWCTAKRIGKQEKQKNRTNRCTIGDLLLQASFGTENRRLIRKIVKHEESGNRRPFTRRILHLRQVLAAKYNSLYILFSSAKGDYHSLLPYTETTDLILQNLTFSLPITSICEHVHKASSRKLQI